jgi:outer membrane protein OmpA-like peptidoglycan-associated protein
MNRTSPIALSAAALFLAACASTSTSEREEGIHGFLEPATGITYYLSVRCVMCQDGVASAGAKRAVSPTSTSTLVAALTPKTQMMPVAYTEGVAVASTTPLTQAGEVMAVAYTENAAMRSSAQSARIQASGKIVSEPPRVSQDLPKPQLKLDTEFASAKRLILFAAGRAGLGPVGKMAVAELAPWAKQAEKVHVHGGADASGHAQRNRELATARAASVKSAFVAAGVDRNKISTGYCSDCYVAANDTEQGRRVNRRVEVELVLQQQLAAQLPAPVHSVEAPGSVPLIQTVALRSVPR